MSNIGKFIQTWNYFIHILQSTSEAVIGSTGKAAPGETSDIDSDSETHFLTYIKGYVTVHSFFIGNRQSPCENC